MLRKKKIDETCEDTVLTLRIRFMTPVFYTILLMALTVITKSAAQFEYTSTVMNALPEYQDIQKKVNCTVVRGGTDIAYRIFSGLLFFVKNEGDKSSLPGIKATTKKSKTSQIFYLREMHFEILQNRESKPYLRLTVKFHDYNTTRRSINITMNLYKPPKDQANEKHATESSVPVVPSPIPAEQLATLVQDKPENQNFEGGIEWIDRVLTHALFHETKKKNFDSNYIEGYLAGPVIVSDLESYNNILKLANYFEHSVS